MKVTVKAPAKINFTLDITGKLPNGYHTVDMVMQAVSLYDTVSAEPRKAGITLACSCNSIPCNSSNTAWKAAEYFFEYTGIKSGASIYIDKQIPCQAGLAGGSADAAAALLALDCLYGTSLKKEELLSLCARVGADVPFCLCGSLMLSTGIGTELQKIDAFPEDIYILLCKPQIGVSTKEAYALADSRPYTSVVHSSDFIKSLIKKDYAGMCSHIYNDFESLLKLEPVNKIKDIMVKNGAKRSSMSGSGPTVFGVFFDYSKALMCEKLLKKEYNDVFLTQPVNFGCEISSIE